jgi:hypothetical protein
MSVQGHVWGDIGLEHYVASGAHPHHFGEIAPYLSARANQGVPIQAYDFETIDRQLPRLVELMSGHGTAFTRLLVCPLRRRDAPTDRGRGRP